MDLRSPEPYWLVKDGLINTYPSLRVDERCDVLIIGCGITGALMAHALTGAGVDCVLVDHRHVGHGSTSATTAMLQYEIDKPLYELIAQVGELKAVRAYRAGVVALQSLERALTDIGRGDLIMPRKSLRLAQRKSHLADLRKEFDIRWRHGFEVQWLDQQEVQRDHAVSAVGALRSLQAGVVDPYAVAHALLAHSVARGARVYDRTGIVQQKYNARGVTARTDTGFQVHARRVVHASGFEACTGLPERIAHLFSTFALVSEPGAEMPAALGDHLYWTMDDPYLYWRNTTDGRILLGGGDVPFRNAAKRDALVWSKKVPELLKGWSRYYPHVPLVPDHAWAGTFGTTRDALPYIGTHPRFPHSFFVLGFGGNGITFSVMGMEMVLAWWHRKSHPLRAAFAFGR